MRIFKAFNILLPIFCLAIFATSFCQQETLSLRNNISQAKAGDYIVAAQNKTYTLLHIYSKNGDVITVEEITVPASKISRENFSWKEWVKNRAPNHTCWVIYTVIGSTGEMRDSYSFSAYGWHAISLEDAFLPTLLNLRFTLLSDKERKKVGSPLSEGGTGGKKLWQPPMVVDGKVVSNVPFDAWRAHWPRDRTPLSDKIIEVYLPKENDKYPSYFPYWIQIAGAVGKADLRVIDSGTGLISPAPPPPNK